VFEWLHGAVAVLDWLRKIFRWRSESAQSHVVVNPGVTADVNKLAEQSSTTARELGRMEFENASLRSENAELRKVLDVAIAGLQRRARFERALAEMDGGNPMIAEKMFRDIVIDNRREAALAVCNIGFIAFPHDTQKALRAFQESISLDPNTAEAWFGVGSLQRRMGNLEEAGSAFGKVLDTGNIDNNDILRSAALSGIGTVLMSRGEWDMAKDKLMSSLKINEQLRDQKNMARSYCDIGTVHLSLGELADADDMYRKALEISENNGDKEVMAMAYCNLGIVLKNRRDTDGAKEMYRKSLVLSEEVGYKEGMANASGNLGQIFLQNRDDLSRAEEMLRKSLKINEELGHKGGMAPNYYNLGFISAFHGDLEEACRLWKNARDIFADMGARDRVEIVEQAMQNAGCEL